MRAANVWNAVSEPSCASMAALLLAAAFRSRPLTRLVCLANSGRTLSQVTFNVPTTTFEALLSELSGTPANRSPSWTWSCAQPVAVGSSLT